MADSVLVTGATGTIGRAMVRAFAAGGYDVAVHFRTNEAVADQLAEQVRALGRNAMSVEADFDTADVDAMCTAVLQAVESELSTPAVVVLNASSQELTPWDDLTADRMDAVYINSLRSNLALLRAAGKRLAVERPGRGVIVVIGSIEGIKPARNHAAYASMKAGLHHLVMSAAQELGPLGVRVVGIAPGLVDREGLSTDWPEGVARWNAAAALGRPVTADEVAQTVLFVAGPQASGITGITIAVDAGWSANPGW